MNDVKDSGALTLMGSDVERIVQALRFIHEVWASIPEMVIAVWLLARQISYACVVPLIVNLGESPFMYIPTPNCAPCSLLIICGL